MVAAPLSKLAPASVGAFLLLQRSYGCQIRKVTYVNPPVDIMNALKQVIWKGFYAASALVVINGAIAYLLGFPSLGEFWGL